ncbi:alpha/beta hydrolase [Pantoea vagans]|uniref:alpha/beta hydrolase n=1 Tax=Pantoea vagans TaxID=470934 RepID=UPI0028EC3E0A|nr:alpha/beta fold hydrolase [Pantoea vagans]
MIDFIRFSERYKQLDDLTPYPEKVRDVDVNGLYIRIYRPDRFVNEVLIVYHGGGVNSDAGYDIPARQLSCALPVCVCLTDIRGHGRSAGLRGDALSPEQIWQDVDTVIDYVRIIYKDARIHLLGHSSGGGMLINYFTRHVLPRKVDSLLLLSPELGPFTPPALHRKLSTPFASVNRWAFIFNALSAGFTGGHRTGVRLNFPSEVIHSRPDFVQVYSVNMANALTPENPTEQLKRLLFPVTILLAEQDELFNVKRMTEFFNSCGNSHLSSQVVKNCRHLDCIFELTDSMKKHFARLFTGT